MNTWDLIKQLVVFFIKCSFVSFMCKHLAVFILIVEFNEAPGIREGCQNWQLSRIPGRPKTKGKKRKGYIRKGRVIFGSAAKIQSHLKINSSTKTISIFVVDHDQTNK